MEMVSIFRQFAQLAGPAAVAELWQGLALALGLAVCLRVARDMSAADRFRGWAAGFATLLALPVLPLLRGWSSAHPMAASTAAMPAARAWLELDQSWALILAGLWVAASVWRATDLAVHALKLRKVWKDAEPIELTIPGVKICSTRHLDRPSVIGFFRPRILFPAWLLERLTPAELEQVVLHEAEHLRRRDVWTNLIQKLALVLFPLNPALIWIERQLCHEREMACDDAVVRVTGKPRAYAACLTGLAERGLERRREALSLGAWRRRPELVGRVHRLLKQGSQLHPAAARALLAVVSAGLVLGSVEFARAPQLVAFVAPVITQSSVPDLVHSDMRAVPGFRAMNAVAHMPGATHAQNASQISRTEKEISGEKACASADKSLRETQGPEQPRASEFFEVAAVEDNSQAVSKQQWIVLTTWEQVTVHPNSRVVADYNVNAATGDDAALEGANTVTAGKWTVTQLLLRVDPARSDFEDDTPDSNSQQSQPAVVPLQPVGIPLHEGWLVFQL
jgi:hypothetical protein